MLDDVVSQLKLAIERRVDDEVADRIDALKARLGDRETDEFGFDPDAVRLIVPVLQWLYRHYFRVETIGLRDMPEGRVLYVANHSGQIPIDGMMIGAALLFDLDPPRAVRSMIERWVPSLPWVGTAFTRWGQVLGTPENCRRLLAREHAIQVFPEGIGGINKTFDKAYQLQEFGTGFLRLALETDTPIVPVAVIGAEEQAPALWNLEKVAKLLGVPALPITPTTMIPILGWLPYPTKYRIHFGRPMRFAGDPEDDDTVIGDMVAQVKGSIAELIEVGLAQRTHVFW